MLTRSGLLTKQELKQFVKEHNFQSIEDIQNTKKSYLQMCFKKHWKSNYDTHLGYNKHDVKNKQTNNSRNGCN